MLGYHHGMESDPNVTIMDESLNTFDDPEGSDGTQDMALASSSPDDALITHL